MKAFVFLCLLQFSMTILGTEYSWDGNSNGYIDTSSSNECTFDDGSCGCCLMQQQMHRMELFFNHSISELEENLARTKTILTNVRANQVAFSVALTNEMSSTCYGPFRDDKLIIYTHVFINMGNSYDPSTGFFTVPRSGVYSLALTVYSDAGAPANSLAACANLQVNNQVVAGPQEKNQQDQEDSASIVIVILLTAGDLVTVNLPIGCFLCDDHSHYNTFSGYLLYSTA